MARRTDFTLEEWNTMRRAMIGAGVLVSVCDGGGTDMIGEMMAVSQQLQAARAGHANQLVRELANITRFRSDYRQGMSVAEFERIAIGAVRSAAATVAAKAPADAEAFAAFVVSVAEAAAGANREGSFMGIGGVRVTQAEAAAIIKVKEALATR